MKRISIGLIVGLMLVGIGSKASADYFLSDNTTNLGLQDFLLEKTTLSTDDPTTELNWINQVMSDKSIPYFFTSITQDKNLDGEWLAVYSDTGGLQSTMFAHPLINDPVFYLIRASNDTGSDYQDFLFFNNPEHEWAVISLVNMGFNNINNTNILKIMLIAEPTSGAAPVPEPATMMLFGTGLAGLVGVMRRKKKD